MTKGCKTTLDERIEIVGYCIENGKDYGRAIEKYGVSYQQVKYEDHGIKGLVDGWSQLKTEADMTETDKLKADNKLLAAKLKRGDDTKHVPCQALY